jgi:hypothetical protein
MSFFKGHRARPFRVSLLRGVRPRALLRGSVAAVFRRRPFFGGRSVARSLSSVRESFAFARIA